MAWWNVFRSGGALAYSRGVQSTVPMAALVEDTRDVGPDGALQLSPVWACVDRRASMVASLPFFVYENKNGVRTLARQDRLYFLLHESPNSRMTPYEFWRALMVNHDLRGNAYARIVRDDKGEALAMWPMPSDQVEMVVMDDGALVYHYRVGQDIAVLAESNVLHLKGLGNGTTGLSKLDYMRATTDEMAKAQSNATKVFGNSGKPTGVLMIDHTLTPEQRDSVRQEFSSLSTGPTARLAVLEANMKYQQLSISPEDQQLLESRKFGVEEICRWFDVPPVLVHHSNVTTWGSGIEQIVDGFHKLTIRPMLISIEQAVRKRVMTAGQRARLSAEFSHDALLRGNIKDRMEVYSKAVQNGLKTRNECRQLENDPPIEYGDELTAQSNLVPLSRLGAAPGAPTL